MKCYLSRCNTKCKTAIIGIKTCQKRDFLTDERTSPMMRYFDEPEEFKNVKDVPAIFTVNNLNFTHGTTEECWCDQPMIERQEQFKCHIMWHII